MLTVILPAHRHEYLAESITSVLAQTFPDFHLLIGINGDQWKKIGEVVERFEHDARVCPIYIDNEGKGFVQVANEMMKLVNTPWVAIQECDDVWLPTKLEHQLPYLDRYDIVGTMAEYIGEKAGRVDVESGELSGWHFDSHNPIVQMSAMLKREDARWDESFARGVYDFALWKRLMLAGRRFFNVPKVLVQHRIHKGSTYNTKNTEAEEARVKAMA